MYRLLKNKKGFSLTEVILSISLMAIIIAFVFIIYSKVKETSNLNNESQTIGIIVSGVQSLYQGQSSYSGLSMDLLVKANILPDSKYFLNNSRFENSWNGAITVTASVGENGETNARFIIAESNIPKRECFQFVHRMYTSYKNIIKTIGVNYVSIYDRDTEYSMDKAIAACKLQDDANSYMYMQF